MNVNKNANGNENHSVYVTRIIDGDTFTGDVPFYLLGHVLLLKDQHFRLEGINAPEIKGDQRPEGLKSKAFLESLIMGKHIAIKVKDRDKYGRWLATLFLDDVNLNQKMVEEGYAEWRDY